MYISGINDNQTQYANFKGFKTALMYAKSKSIFGSNIENFNIKKLEGIQKNLKTFEGLSIKQILFALSNLGAIIMMNGCKNHCFHCYANAQPFIKRYPFEDFLQILNDIKTLRKRLGVKNIDRNNTLLEPTFDSDGIDTHLYDKKGKKHDFIELAKLIKEKTNGFTPVFDTGGWNRNDKEKQALAEEYVKNLLKKKNYKNFMSINISLNPFHPEYVKALSMGYNPKTNTGPKTAREKYKEYVSNVANTLLTFAPLLDTGKLGCLIRVFDDDFYEMKGFRASDFRITLKNIYSELGKFNRKGLLSDNHLQMYSKTLSYIDTNLLDSGRLVGFYEQRNPLAPEALRRYTFNRKADRDKRLQKIKETRKLSAGNIKYQKIATPDGKIYLYDNYSLIPTDIQFKTSTQNIDRPLHIPVRDFTLTEDMIDIII